MTNTVNRINAITLFSIIVFVAGTCLFSSMNVQAQFFPFPVYPYFSPFIPYSPLFFPIPPAVASPLPTATLAPLPTATILGTTIYIPLTVTSFNLGINAPGVGTITKLTGLTAPTTIIIYPAGYVPPPPVAPPVVVPTIPAPTIAVPTIIAPTLIPPTVIVPTAIAPSVTATAPAIVSGLFLPFLPFSRPSFSFFPFPLF
jgi:hypothetical protein